jgi:ketosteroid isomerase-like protein
MRSFQKFLLSRVILIIVFIPACSQISKNEDPDVEKVKAKLAVINKRIKNCFEKKQVDSLINLYAQEFYYLPEYKQAITNTNDLRNFYNDWLGLVSIKNYEKKIYDVKLIPGYACEIGTFNLDYLKQNGDGASYTGKYMMMWKINDDGSLRILSEIFGSDRSINPNKMPYALVMVKENDLLKKNILGKKLAGEVGTFDSVVVQSILNGDGSARAKGFADDGIYMPHFDKMLVGMKEIKPYMIKTYQRGFITAVTDTYHEIFDVGDFVFFDGHFKVDLENANGRSSFEGDMSDLMIRGKDGKLLMLRQLAHNDGEQIMDSK